MVVKRFFISMSMLLLGALLLQAKNIIERDMGVKKVMFRQTLLSLILIVALLPKT